MADALSAHQKALETGGLDGMPNLGLVESAINRPYSGHYRPIAQKAAALVQSMATNHGFADGNKRTTIILTHLLLQKSNYHIVPLDADPNLSRLMENLVLSVVRHDLDFEELVDWFRARIKRPQN